MVRIRRLRSRALFLGGILLVTISLLAPPALAKIGVGVDLAKIAVNKPLMPGGIYRLPSVTVINTGDEVHDYTLEVTYHYKQPQLMPPGSWFIFTPETFELNPGRTQVVDIRMRVPVSARPGDYFAYVEAHPIAKKKGVTIGVAAATRLYFSVKPANILSAIWWRIVTFLSITAPFSYIVLITIVVVVGILSFLKYFRISLSVKRRG